MGNPMKALKHFFTERAYGEAKDNDNVDGMIVTIEDFNKMQEYIKWAEETVKEVTTHADEIDTQYKSQIENVNATIRNINKQVEEITKSVQSIDLSKISVMIQRGIQQLQEEIGLEVGEFSRNKDNNGKEIGGLHATVSDSKLGKNRGGIIKSLDDETDYTGKYIKLAKIAEVMEPIVIQIKEMQKEGNETKTPKIEEIVAQGMSDFGNKSIQQNNGLKGVKVTQKTFLRKRTAVALIALGLAATATVGSLRGNNVIIAGAHGNNVAVTEVEQQIVDAQNEYEDAYRQLGMDYQEKLEEESTLGEFIGDSALVGEEKRIDYQTVGNGLVQKEEDIKTSYDDVSSLSQEDAADYYIAQYNLLIELYNKTLEAYDEDAIYTQGIIDANQEHLDISNGTMSPQSGQEGLVGSLEEDDISRHEAQQQSARITQIQNAESEKDIESKINAAKQRIEFINSLKQMKNFKEITQGNFENVFESLYQMYVGHSAEISMEDFMQILNDKEYDLDVMAEYAKEEADELTFKESLARFGLIDNSYKVYLKEYELDGSQVDISSYTQFTNQYIEDNPEIGKDGGFFITVEGEFSQNDMNSGFYNNRQEGTGKDGTMKAIWRNLKTIFNSQRRSEYKQAVSEQTNAIKEAQEQETDLSERR